MSLRERLIARIAETGPMPVSDYMTACLHDGREGYYATRPGLGAAGDFITSPHVSQMFGELLGVWAIEVWMRMGRPDRFRLVELGPGDGTMMSDMLRSARRVPAVVAAADIWLVETSPPLKAAQAAALAEASVRWVDALADLPCEVPFIFIANEFLDCLPIDQWVCRGSTRAHRRVGLNGGGDLAFVVDAPAQSPASDGEAEIVLEGSAALAALGRELGALLARAGGAGLFIDYGSVEGGHGDTLQALRGHAKESPLAHPGEADLTAHVDFPAFLRAVRAGGAQTAPLLTQCAFLRSLGIEARAGALCAANPAKADIIGRQLGRLIAPAGMGALFKVARVHSPGLDIP